MLGPKPDAPERKVWEFVTERSVQGYDRALTAYGVRIGNDMFWVHTATDLTAPKTRERYRQRCLLMAAAPDLLEAACLAQQTFIELFCEYECECVGPGSGCESCPVSKALAVLDKAIRRAKGEEEDGPFKGEEAHSCESGTDAK